MMTFPDALLLLAALVCGATAWRGSTPERVLSACLLGDLLAERLLGRWVGEEFATTQGWIYFVLELLLLAVVFRVALRANRVYPLWIGGAEIVAVVAHVTWIILGDRVVRACETIDDAAAGGSIVALIVGLSCHVQRTRRLGRGYPDWTISSPNRRSGAVQRR